MEADIKTLEQLAARMKQDALRGHSMHPSFVASIASIIEAAIGAPLMWPSRRAGAQAADEYYPGAPDLRHGFNAGVKWAVEHYDATQQIEWR
jgi:hypothetical protein